MHLFISTLNNVKMNRVNENKCMARGIHWKPQLQILVHAYPDI